MISEAKQKEACTLEQIRVAEQELDDIRNKIAAGVRANLKEQEIKEKENFYRLPLSVEDEEDIKKLNAIKVMLHNPMILSKLIWSTYFQKQTNELCNRVFGSSTVCGIYKITNLNTKQAYVGQSVNIQDRMKAHIKAGLGIEASSTNKLYNAMQREGVWNFTFELLEECPKDKLNEREVFWIETYQSDKVGYNLTRGGS